jgi:hypothetical protein
MLRESLSVPLVLALALPALTQQEPAALQPKELTLKAAAAPVPALKYRLLPEVGDLQPGNALICYMRAFLPELYNTAPRGKELEKLDDLLDMPFEEFKQAKTPRPGLPRLALKEIDQGARREYCDWEMLARLRKDGLATMVPDIQSFRQVARLLEYRARLEMAESLIDKAAYTIQTMLTLSHHVGGQPLLISELVGMAIASLGLDQVEDFIQQPGSPNLYWALTGLPRPFIDIRKGLEGDKVAMEVYFPELKKLEKEPLSAEELKRLVNICADTNAVIFGGKKDAAFPSKVKLVGLVVDQYPAARQAMIDQGRKAEEVDALTMLQVVLIQNYRQCRRFQDEMEKWIYVPFWEGHKARKAVEDDARKLGSAWPFGQFIPAAARVYEASVRVDRRIAALRCIEALRLHVAATAKLPGLLDEITLVPIPLDPYTGKQFQYTALGDEVTLFGPPPPGAPARENNIISYRIAIKR